MPGDIPSLPKVPRYPVSAWVPFYFMVLIVENLPRSKKEEVRLTYPKERMDEELFLHTVKLCNQYILQYK